MPPAATTGPSTEPPGSFPVDAGGDEPPAPADRWRCNLPLTLAISLPLNAVLALAGAVPSVYATMLLLDLAGEVGLTRPSSNLTDEGVGFAVFVVGLACVAFLAVVLLVNWPLQRHSTMTAWSYWCVVLLMLSIPSVCASIFVVGALAF